MRVRPNLRGHSLRGHSLTGHSLTGHSLRTALTACLAVAAVALAAGCSAPPASKFAAFPISKVWSGPGGKFQAIVGPLSGSGQEKTFTFAAGSNLVIWFGCLGTGTAHLSSKDMALDWHVTCDSNPDPIATQINPTNAPAGKKVTVDLTIPAGAKWEIRVDAPAVAAA